MNQLLDAWKEVPDVFDDGSPPPHSQESSRGQFLVLSPFLMFC